MTSSAAVSSSPNSFPWLPLALFKLQWLLLVPGRSAFLVPATLLLVLQLVLLLRQRGVVSLGPALLFALAGMALDQTLMLLGVLRFDEQRLPLPLAVLWLAFALMLPLLSVLERLRPASLALVSLLLGVVGYGAAMLLGVVRSDLPSWQALLLLAACWTLVLPLRRALLQLCSPAAVILLLALQPMPSLRAEPVDEWPIIGNATYRVLWYSVYDAMLQSPASDFSFPGQPFKLTLRYHRPITASQIVNSTLDQWRHQRIDWLPQWRDTLTAAIPAVAPGDSLRLEVPPTGSATLALNDTVIARFDDEVLVTALASIWLGEATSNPGFRLQLLGVRQ